VHSVKGFHRSKHLNMDKKDIQILRVLPLRGPNLWTYRPVLEAWVDIGALEDFPSNTLPGFYERLAAWLPPWWSTAAAWASGAAS
jgi:hypothetical protein